MPALVLFGHRTALAGDDLEIFTLFAIILRLLQFGFLIPLIVFILRIDRTRKGCVRNQNYEDYGWTMIVLFWSFSFATITLSLIVEFFILRTSMQGTPTQTEKRNLLRPLCAVKLIPLAILRMAALAVGITSATIVEDYCFCGDGSRVDLVNICPGFDTIYLLMQGLLILTAIEVAAGFALQLYFVLKVVRPRHRLQSITGRLTGRTAPQRGQGWQITCRFCCTCTSLLTCCLFGGLEAALADFVDVSLALEELFDGGGYLDVTLSDIINGLLLVAQQQREKREQARKEIVNKKKEIENGGATSYVEGDGNRRHLQQLRASQRDLGDRGDAYSIESCDRLLLNPAIEEDRLAIEEGAHFMHLAFGIYGHRMYLINDPVRGPISLLKSAIKLWIARKCCFSESPKVKGDIPCCSCNTAALLQASHLEPEDLIYSSFRSGLKVRPYSVIVDKSWKAVVVVVRGTFGLEDAVADLTIRPTPLEAYGDRFGFDGNGGFAHAGMLASAEWVYSDIETKHILDGLIVGDSCSHPDFKLYVVGHSLGAGVAALLSIMLQQKYKNLKCLCFEPPGCVVTKEVANKDYITSFVHGSDIVPRLSLQSVENLRDRVLMMIAQSRVPKFEVLSPALSCAKDGTAKSIEEALHLQQSIPNSKFYSDILCFWEYQENLRAERGEASALLVIPGKTIINLVKIKDAVNNISELLPFSSMACEPYAAVYADRDDFLEIQLASSHLTDHSPGLVAQELERMVKSFRIYQMEPKKEEISDHDRSFLQVEQEGVEVSAVTCLVDNKTWTGKVT